MVHVRGGVPFPVRWSDPSTTKKNRLGRNLRGDEALVIDRILAPPRALPWSYVLTDSCLQSFGLGTSLASLTLSFCFFLWPDMADNLDARYLHAMIAFATGDPDSTAKAAAEGQSRRAALSAEPIRAKRRLVRRGEPSGAPEEQPAPPKRARPEVAISRYSEGAAVAESDPPPVGRIYDPGWSVRDTDSVEAEPTVAAALLKGVVLPVDRERLVDYTDETVQAKLPQFLMQTANYCQEMISRLSISNAEVLRVGAEYAEFKETAASLAEESNRKMGVLRSEAAELRAEKEALEERVRALERTKAKLKAAKSRLKRSAKRAVEDFKESEECLQLKQDFSAKAFRTGFRLCRRSVRLAYPSMDLSMISLRTPNPDASRQMDYEVSDTENYGVIPVLPPPRAPYPPIVLELPAGEELVDEAVVEKDSLAEKAGETGKDARSGAPAPGPYVPLPAGDDPSDLPSWSENEEDADVV